MGKRRRDRGGAQDSTDWSTERTLADAEADAAAALEEERIAEELRLSGVPMVGTPLNSPGERTLPSVASVSGWGETEPGAASGESSATCACGSEEFLLEAYLAVVRGRPQREPVELELLTCPQCGREYEAIWLQDGRIARGEYRGQTELDE